MQLQQTGKNRAADCFTGGLDGAVINSILDFVHKPQESEGKTNTYGKGLSH